MTRRQQEIIRNVALGYSVFAVVLTLVVLSYLIVSPGEVFTEPYHEDTSADRSDQRIVGLWVLWGLILGVVAGMIAGFMQDEIKHTVKREKWQIEAEKAEINHLRRMVQFDRDSLERHKARHATIVKRHHEVMDIGQDLRYANDERTHTIAIRYNNLRSNP